MSNEERKMVMYTGCKIYGLINVMKKTCNDPECKPCSNFNKALKEEAEKWIFHE